MSWTRAERLASMQAEPWTPQYEPWRHGGWYVSNVYYLGGGVGCVSRNYPDGKWRIVCAGHDEITYGSRDAAGRAERAIAIAEYEADERMSEAMRYDPEYQERTGFARNH